MIHLVQSLIVQDVENKKLIDVVIVENYQQSINVLNVDLRDLTKNGKSYYNF